MKKRTVDLLSAISALDPATTSVVKNFILVLRNGLEFHTDDVTVDRGMVFARTETASDNPDVWFLGPIEEIVGIKVEINRAGCAHFGIDPTLPAVLERSLSN